MIYILAIVGSFLAGCVNTLAGNGSAITLTILMEMLGLPPDVANATNRVGIFTQGLASNYAFHREKKLQEAWNWPLIIWVTLGAVLGIYLSIIISPAGFKTVFRYLLVLMLLVILVKPSRWLRLADPGKAPLSPWVSVPLFFTLGVYGGFIQMGMGVFFLAVLVLIARYEIIGANVLKGVVVMLYTGLALAVFAWKGLVDWQLGGLMAIGQTIGGFLTATFASRYPKANIWAYRLLVLVIVLAILKAFG